MEFVNLFSMVCFAFMLCQLQYKSVLFSLTIKNTVLSLSKCNTKHDQCFTVQLFAVVVAKLRYVMKNNDKLRWSLFIGY